MKKLSYLLPLLLLQLGCADEPIDKTLTDVDGNNYQTVQIGEQVWMAENLKTMHYADGSAIPLVTGEQEWDALTETSKAYCWFDNNTVNRDTYGGLYTWAAAMNGAASSIANPSGVQGVCPDRWHLPSDAEWTELADYFGGANIAGHKMKGPGFNALPGGHRIVEGAFYGVGISISFWTATDSDASDAWYRNLYAENWGVYRYGSGKAAGFSVRCVKD